MAGKRKETSGTNPEKPPVPVQEKPPPGAPVAESANGAQMQWLEQGLRLFRQQRFADARGYFEKAAEGPLRNVMLTARNHMAVCDRRLPAPELAVRSAEDYYNHGVERLNARDLPEARKHLEQAVALRPQCEYMLYALAAAYALSGNTTQCYENLRRAIQGDSRNRSAARRDPDFASVVHDPQFDSLLHPERV